MLDPVIEVLEAQSRVNSIDEHSNLNVAHEEVRQLLHVSIAGGVPNI